MQNGSKFMAILPEVNVVVEFYSRFPGEKGKSQYMYLIRRLHKHSAVPIMLTHNDLSLSQYFYVTGFNGL